MFILLVSLGLMSCDLLAGTTAKPAEDPDVVYEDFIVTNDDIPSDKKEVAEKEEVKKEEGKEADIVVNFHDAEYTVSPHKEQFNIALILPFYYKAKTDYEQRFSDVMLEYFEGLEMALNDLEAQGFKMKLFIYDNRNDTNLLKSILRKNEFEEMDLIIGPVNMDHLNIVSKFSLQTGIPVFSPFTGIAECPETNPILYSYIPGFKMKAKLMVDFMENEHRGEKLVILRDGGYLDKNFVPYLLEELDTRKSVAYVREAYSRNNRWEYLLTKDSGNVVYIASDNRSVVSASISGIFASKRSVSILGENSWADFEDNDYNFWTQTNVHLMAYDFVDQNDTAVLEFRKEFREINFEDPSAYAYMGYDQMKFIGDFLMAFGEYFPLYISEKEFDYLSTKYKFIFENGCNENATLFFLKYEDNRLTPLH